MKRITTCLLCAWLVSAFAQPQPGSPWPMSRHDAKNTALCPLSFAGKNFRCGLLPMNFQPLALDANGNLYGTNNDDSCLDAYTLAGKHLWTFTGLGSNEFNSGLTVAADGTVYGLFRDYLVAINSDGTEKWRFHAAENCYSDTAIDVQGNIYFGCESGSTSPLLYKIRPNGALAWSVPGEMDDPRILISSTGQILVYGYGYLDNLAHYDVHNSDGKLLWRVSDGLFTSYMQPAIGDDGTIYFATSDRYLNAYGQDGAIHWRFKLPGASDEVVIGPDGTIYLSSRPAPHAVLLNAIDPSGSVKWSTPCDGYGDLVGVTAEGYVHTGVQIFRPDGRLLRDAYAYWPLFTADGAVVREGSVHRLTYDIKWLIYGDTGFHGTIAPDDTIYRMIEYSSTGSYLVRLDKYGNELWRNSSGYTANPPKFDSKGNAYLCTWDRLRIIDKHGQAVGTLMGSFWDAVPRVDGSILLLFSGSILCVNADFGLLWAYYDGNIRQIKLGDNGRIYTVANRSNAVAGSIIVLDGNGSMIWQREFTTRWIAGIDLQSDGAVALATISGTQSDAVGTTYVFNPDGSNKWYSEGWSLNKVIWGKNGGLFALGSNGIIAYSPIGQILWKRTGGFTGMFIDVNGFLNVYDYLKTFAVDAGGNPVAVCPIGGLEVYALSDGTTVSVNDDSVSRYELWQRKLSGKLDLGNLAGPPPQFLSLDFRQPGDAAGIFQSCVIDAAGNYTAAAPARALDVAYQTGSWLRRTVPGVDLGAGDQVVNVSLINGDANGDNVVGVADMNAIFMAFGGVGDGDLDRSGAVDLKDLNIVFVNFGAKGDH